MQTDVLFGCPEQIGHELLGHPDGFGLESALDFDCAVFGLEEDNLASPT